MTKIAKRAAPAGKVWWGRLDETDEGRASGKGSGAAHSVHVLLTLAFCYSHFATRAMRVSTAVLRLSSWSIAPAMGATGALMVICLVAGHSALEALSVSTTSRPAASVL